MRNASLLRYLLLAVIARSVISASLAECLLAFVAGNV